MEEVVIKRSMAIYGGSLKRKWNVEKLVTIDGIEFMELTLRDKGLVYFLGKHLRSRSASLLCTLRNLRHDAMLKATEQDANAAAALFGDAPNIGVRQLKKQRRNTRDAEERGDLPKMVTISLPHTGAAVKVRTALNRLSNVWVEATAVALAAIRQSTSMMQDPADEGQATIETRKGVYWRADRKCFIAKSPSGKLKMFRPDGEDDESKKVAAVAAAEWIANEGE